MGWGGFGSGVSNSDYKANSVQLQLQLHTGTELGQKEHSNWSVEPLRTTVVSL